MLEQNLGKLLAEAGIKVGKIPPPPLTIEEARAMAIKSPDEPHSDEAMRRLPPEFNPLRETSKGEEFMKRLRNVLDGLIANNRGEIVTEHVVFGIVQLAHHRYDNLTGSKRTSFKRIIPTLLDIKNTMLKSSPKNVVEFFVRKLQ